jgi:hypothetical protein
MAGEVWHCSYAIRTLHVGVHDDSCAVCVFCTEREVRGSSYTI